MSFIDIRMSHQIDDSLDQRLVREIDLMDAALSRQSALISQATESNEWMQCQQEKEGC